jgi:tRNA threonylcarbamoyl adenosine modification protein YjeE
MPATPPQEVSLELPDLEATTRLGRRLGSLLFPGAVVALGGELGAGKTQLARAIAEGLGLADGRVVTSPTFVLVQEYQGRLPIFHFDAYRLHSEGEFADLGIEEYYQAGGVCLVEWADRVWGCLPPEYLCVRLEVTGDTSRRATLQARGRPYEALVQTLQRLLMPQESGSPQPAAQGPEATPAAPAPLPVAPSPSSPSRRRRRWRLAAILVAGLLAVYLGVAYVALPTFWKGYARRHPSLEDIPGISYTANGIPGDPLNVALIGTKAEVVRAMLAAGWYPADPITLRSSLEIAAASVLRRSYDQAPVSSLYMAGRKQDLAFEQPVGRDPRHRHHVRFWLSDKADPDGRPLWVGAAIYDERVGLSHRTEQITHHTGADIDAERDKLFGDLEQAGVLSEVTVEQGFHKVREGRNGGGDPWHTDGNLYLGVVKPALAQAGP